MKKLLLCFLFVFCLLFQSYAQTPVEAVTKALQTGNASEIAKQFDKVIDITINNEQATDCQASLYWRRMAEVAILLSSIQLEKEIQTDKR